MTSFTTRRADSARHLRDVQHCAYHDRHKLPSKKGGVS